MKYFMIASLLIACEDKENDSAEPEEVVEESEESEESPEESEQLNTAGRHGLQMPRSWRL